MLARVRLEWWREAVAEAAGTGGLRAQPIVRSLSENRAAPSTLLPRNGGVKTGLSVTTSGERAGSSTGASSSPPGLAKRRPARASELDRHHAPVVVVGVSPRLIVADAVHHVEALEGVLAVEAGGPRRPRRRSLLDVGAGQRRAAEQHRDRRPGRGRSAPRGSRCMISVDFTSRPAHADRVGLAPRWPCRSSRRSRP